MTCPPTGQRRPLPRNDGVDVYAEFTAIPREGVMVPLPVVHLHYKHSIQYIDSNKCIHSTGCNSLDLICNDDVRKQKLVAKIYENN